jgi:hypothetical protein
MEKPRRSSGASPEGQNRRVKDMKEYIVTTTSVAGALKNAGFDNYDEAVKCADKRQKTRKSAVVVLKKVGEDEKETVYLEQYNAKGLPLVPVKYGFLK